MIIVFRRVKRCVAQVGNIAYRLIFKAVVSERYRDVTAADKRACLYPRKRLIVDESITSTIVERMQTEASPAPFLSYGMSFRKRIQSDSLCSNIFCFSSAVGKVRQSR